MLSYIWPLALVVFSNVFYQISAKSVPDGMNPLASLTITYGVGTVASLLAVILIFVGYLLYKEAITWNKILGIVVCLIGLGLINLK